MAQKPTPQMKRSIAFMPFWALALVAAGQFKFEGITFLAVVVLGAVVPGYMVVRIWPIDGVSLKWPSMKESHGTLTRWVPFFAAVFAGAGFDLLLESQWVSVTAALVAGVSAKVLVQRLL